MKVTSISFSQDLSQAYIYVENAGVRAVKILRVTINGEDVTSSSEIMGGTLEPKDKTVIVVKPEGGFKRGEKVRFKIESEASVAEAEIRVFPAVFPVGIYGGSVVVSDRDSALEAIEMGLDTIVAGVNDLDAAQKYGFKVIAYAPRAKDSVDLNLESIEKFKEHPSLLAWYIIDEPDIWEIRGAVPEGWTARWSEEVKRIDKRNPTYIVLCNPWIFERFAKIPDVLAIDPYPVTWGPLTHVTFMAEKAVAVASPSPVWLIPQAFRHGRPPRKGRWGWNRFPSPQEERIMVFMGLSHGLKGVIYFTFGSWIDNPDDPVEGVSSTHLDALLLRRAVARMSGELHSLGPILALADVVTRNRSWISWSRTGSIEVGSVLSGNRAVILFAINHNYVSTEEGFKIDPAKNVIIETRVPGWFDIKDTFLLDQQGLRDIKMERFDNKIVFKLPEIETTSTIILARDENLRSRIEDEWSRWRRY